MSVLPIIWNNVPAAAKAQVSEELRGLAEGMDSPDDLIYHLIILTANDYGPSVVVWGEGGSFHCEYSRITAYVGLE